MTTTLDIAALVAAVAMPAVLLIALAWFREPLAAALRELPKRIESISFAGISVKLAEAKEGALVGPAARVDLRNAGTPQDVIDATAHSFYEQVSDPARIDYAVVDLDAGMSWLSSRLYILSVILRRMRGMRSLVFVATIGSTRRRFVGVCSSDIVRWRLASRWPRLESALAMAELQTWGHPYQALPAPPAGPPPIALPVVVPGNDQLPQIPPMSGQVRVVNDEGRIERSPSPQPAIDMLVSFLAGIQRESAPPGETDWSPLPAADPPRVELAVWLDPKRLEGLLGDALDQRSIRLGDFQGWSDDQRARAVFEHAGDWIAITRDDFVFDRLIDRRQFVELAIQRTGA
jgi:hypothetical protein